MTAVTPLGPSPFDDDHQSLLTRRSSLQEQIASLQAEHDLIQEQIETILLRRAQWEKEEMARLQREEEERLERERREREEAERLERERLEREREEAEQLERERIEREEREREEKERIERQEAERQARIEAERLAAEQAAAAAALEKEMAAKAAEKKRLEEEWAAREKAEEVAREEAKEKERREREAALAAASAGAIAAHTSTSSSPSPSSGPRELHLRCQALYDLDGDESNDELSFVTGDLFTVSGEMNGWMSARQERTGKVGLVPSNYLKVLEVLPPPTSDISASPQPSMDEMEVKEVEKEKKGEIVVALFDFVGENEDELSFNTGDRLYKTGEVNGWYIGTLEGQSKVGIFPSNFVEVAPVEVETPIAVSSTTYAASVIPTPDVRRTKSTALAAAEVASLAQTAQETTAPSTPRSSMGLTAVNVSPVGGVEPDAVALYKFTATSHDQLSFDKGAKLVIKATLNGWYVGQEIGRPALGIFPANYVQKVDKAVEKEEEEVKQQLDGDEEASYRYKTKTMDAPMPATPAKQEVVSNAPKVIGRVTALYDFNSQTPENLSFSKGDEIAVVKEIKGWWAGYVVGKDKLGLVPSNYCTAFRPETTETGSSVGGVTKTESSGRASADRLSSGGVKYPVVGSSVSNVQPVTVNPSTSTASVNSVAPSSFSSSPASTVGPPPLSAKPALLSSLALGTQSNLASASSSSVSSYPVVGSGRPSLGSGVPSASIGRLSAGATPVAVIAPKTEQPNSIESTNGQPIILPSFSSSNPPVTAVTQPLAAVPAHALTTPSTPSSSSSSSYAVPLTSSSAASAVAAGLTKLNPTDRLAVALHDWDTTEKGELRFKKDERLVITKEKQGWYTGYVEGTQRRGMFPSMAVQIISPTPSTSIPPTTQIHHAPSHSFSSSIAPTAFNTPSQTPSQSNPSTPVSGTRPLSSLPSTSHSSLNSVVVQELEKGMLVTKLDSKGTAGKQVRLYLQKEVLSRGKVGDWIIRWDTKKFNKREAQMTIAKCRVKKGLKRDAPNTRGYPFTVFSPVRDLEIICQTEAEREMWLDALVSLKVPLEVAVDKLGGGSVVNAPVGGGKEEEEEDEVVSMNDILRNGPPSPANSHPAHTAHTQTVNTVQMQTQPAVVSSAARQSISSVSSSSSPLQQSSSLSSLSSSAVPVTSGVRTCTALYDFGTEVDDLVFVAGDKIELIDSDKATEWWSGRNLTKGGQGSRVGMFPSSYVTLDNPSPPKQVTIVQPVLQPTLAAVSGVKAKALYDFDTDTTQFPDDLPFKQGDVLTLISYGKEMEWWTGQDVKGRKGTFPATFVKIM